MLKNGPTAQCVDYIATSRGPRRGPTLSGSDSMVGALCLGLAPRRKVCKHKLPLKSNLRGSLCLTWGDR